MSRAGRFLFKLLFAGALAGAVYVGWVSFVASPAPLDLIPAGASLVVEARDLEGLSRSLAGTRFAAAFSQSATRRWLERTEPVVAFDAVLAEVGRITHITPSRDSAFDFVGSAAAAAWYPAPGVGSTAAAPWVAGGRLSLRAWAIATAMRLGLRTGLAAASVGREDVAGRVLYTFPGGTGEALHVFLAGRVLVCGSDRSLVLKAARAVSDASAGVTREPGWVGIQKALPADGELFVWARDRRALPGDLQTASAGYGAVGARLRAGRTVELDVAAEPDAARKANGTPTDTAAPLPGLALQHRDPLFLLTSRGPVPAVLADLLDARARAVSRRYPGAASALTAVNQPGRGFAVIITEGTGGSGLFPAPRGLVMIGMPGAAAAAAALPALFPPGARSAAAAGTRALATRESFPLAGEFELWGAAIGSQLVFATETELLDAATKPATAETTRQMGDPTWPVEAFASVSVDKAVPLLRRWSAPLSGLVAARWPEMPDVVRDIGLLEAIGTARLSVGSDGRFDRAAITLTVHDLH